MKTGEYEQALRELEQMHKQGQIDDARYEVHKARMLGELSRPPVNWRNIVWWVLFVLVGVPIILLMLTAALQ